MKEIKNMYNNINKVSNSREVRYSSSNKKQSYNSIKDILKQTREENSTGRQYENSPDPYGSRNKMKLPPSNSQIEIKKYDDL